MIDPEFSNMTESELIKVANEMKELLKEGEATVRVAQRYTEVQKALEIIQTAKQPRPKWWI